MFLGININYIILSLLETMEHLIETIVAIVYVTTSTIYGGLLHLMNYKIGFLPPKLSKTGQITPSSGFRWWFCYSDGGFVFFFFIYFC